MRQGYCSAVVFVTFVVLVFVVVAEEILVSVTCVLVLVPVKTVVVMVL